LLTTLPRILRLSQSPTGDDSLRALIDLTIAESRTPRPGGEAVRLRLSELMFVEVVRRYLASLSADATGWVAALRDETVGRAVALLHESPSEAWTLARIAKSVGVSRSVLADRFTHLVGHPPMQYLTRWRMQLAARQLSDGSLKVSSIAREVGYESEAAFSRAFKKVAGVAPAVWRNRSRA
jgi:AraC-like DNA-binding protein